VTHCTEGALEERAHLARKAGLVTKRRSVRMVYDPKSPVLPYTSCCYRAQSQ